jgi:outer membrane protein OmpA-like peptidoglycan-associated protein/tetratricopeptide (TPR) repeat protein
MDKLLITLTLLCCLTVSGICQSAMEKGDRYFNKKDYENALVAYLAMGASDDPDLNYKIGYSYLYTEKKSRAAAYLEKAFRAKPNVDPDIDFYLGMAYQNDHQYAKAREHYEEFRRKNKKLAELTTEKIFACEIGDSLTRKPVNVLIENAGGEVNSAFHEYSPLVTGDGKTMIFTSNRSEDDYKIKSGTNFEDIYVSQKVGENWGPPKKISPNINIKFNDAAASLSADGNTLLLYYEEGAGDILMSKRDGDDWSKPVSLNKNINTPLFWETSACMSADGKRLFFASNRPGGRGELDIWVSELDAKGQWGKAVNLGPTVNTPGNEDSPYIHPDGVTLYFSSDGHPGMGSNDIFMTEFKNGKWTRPVNLGYPVNSIEYDGFFSMSEDKKTGHYSTLRADGLGSADIYKVTFLPPKQEKPILLASNEPQVQPVVVEPVVQPVVEQPKVVEPVVVVPPPPVETPVAVVETPKVETPVVETPPPPTVVVEEPKKEEPKQVEPPVVAVAEPAKVEEYIDPSIQQSKDAKVVTILKGKVIDETTAKPLGAVISLVNNETGKVVTRINSNAETGDFELTIPHGGNYGVSTERSGYLFNSINFNLPAFAEFQEIDTHIIMVKAEVGSIAVLKNVFFDVGKSELKTESVAEVEKIRELLVSQPHLVVQINGHTDNTGNAANNKTLSLKRATSVVDYLVQHGIAATRVSAKGFGAERPIVSNDDETEGRAINRRTEIEILESNGG